jgi:hypothetical protein
MCGCPQHPTSPQGNPLCTCNCPEHDGFAKVPAPRRRKPPPPEEMLYLCEPRTGGDLHILDVGAILIDRRN